MIKLSTIALKLLALIVPALVKSAAAVISKILVTLIVPLLAKSAAAVISKILVTLIVPLLLKLAVSIEAFPETVSVSFVLQVKSLAESLLLKSPPTERLRALVVIVPLA